MRDKQHPVQVVTTAPESLADDQDHRAKRYLLTMAVRTTAFVLAVVTDGWVRWTFAVLAVFLPWIAVVLANAVRPRAFGRPQQPVVDPRRQVEGRREDPPA